MKRKYSYKLAVLAALITFQLSLAQVTTQTFVYTGAIQQFTVPTLCVNSLTVQAKGAQGGYHATSTFSPGLGADITGVVAVTAGQVLKIMVGQQPSQVTPGNGGGGGSFVTDLSNSPLIVAGGGGGGSGVADLPSKHGQAGTTGGNGAAGGTGVGGTGGTAGNGGNIGTSSYNGGAGGGLLTNGAAGSGGVNSGGKSFLNLGVGGTGGAAGGYGGGGTGSLYYVGGGGGGYSGGGAGGNDGGSGGGGGSFNAGTSQVNLGGVNSGHGVVIISYQLGQPITLVSTATAICNGGSATLTASGAVTYTWAPGVYGNTLAVSPVVTTVYTVQGTNAQGCIGNAAITITVNGAVPSLTVANTASTTGGVCPNSTVALTASGALSYAWSGGSGGITNGVPFTPLLPADYTVTGTNACGSTTAAASVSIHPAPSLTVVASTTSLCSGNTATLTATGANTLSWSNGVQNGVSFTPIVTTTYVVTGTNTANGCTASAASPITVVPTPILAPVITPTLLCAGKTATFTASGATNYSWSTNQTTSSITVSPVITTTYSVTKWNSNCVDTKTFTLFVNQPPTILTNANPTTICAQQTTTLDAFGGISYTWQPYGGNLSQAIVSAAANVIFTVSASDGTCVGTAQIPITVNPLPTVNIVASAATLCANQPVTLTVSGTDTYSWTNPTGLGTATTIVDTPAGNMSYQVTGTNTLTGCSSSTSAIVLVSARPSLTVAASKTLVCIGGPSTLSVKGASVAVQWLHNAATTTATIVNPLTTTVYSVTATSTVSGCPSTSLVTVNVFQPTFAVNSPTSSCAGGTITLMASGANSYTWQTTPPLPFANIPVSPGGPTVYVVVATSTLSGVTCTSSNQVNVSIYSNPTLTAVPSRTQICTKTETVDLQASGAVSYTWNTQQTGSMVTTGPLNGQTNYTVTGTDQNGCAGSATVQVKTSGCVGIGENTGMGQLTIYPNPSNGEFNVSSPADITLTLVNELGQVVRTIELNAMNDRKVSVTDLARGMYFINSKDGDMVKQKIIVTR